MTLDEALASGRHVITFSAGAMSAFGMTKIINPADLVTSFDHIFNGVKEIAVGVGPLVGIGMGWWATHKSSPSAQMATVSAMPEVKQITTSSTTLATAAKLADPQTEVKVVP